MFSKPSEPAKPNMLVWASEEHSETPARKRAFEACMSVPESKARTFQAMVRASNVIQSDAELTHQVEHDIWIVRLWRKVNIIFQADSTFIGFERSGTITEEHFLHIADVLRAIAEDFARGESGGEIVGDGRRGDE